MLPVLATDWLPWVAAICVLSVVVLLLIIVAPWRGVRDEPKLDQEVQARLLLGEDPDEIDRDLASREADQRRVAELRARESGTERPDAEPED